MDTSTSDAHKYSNVPGGPSGTFRVSECVCEREREKERERLSILYTVMATGL